jgi:hypothetical protein
MNIKQSSQQYEIQMNDYQLLAESINEALMRQIAELARREPQPASP